MSPKCVRLLFLLSCVAARSPERGLFRIVHVTSPQALTLRARDFRLLLPLFQNILSSISLKDILRPSCSSGWFYYRSHCYGYFRKLGTWPDAELECQLYGNGSHLASVTNQKEARVISKYITWYQRNVPVWIGLHDPQKKQLWQWIDGSTHQYRPWSSKTKSKARHCAELNPKETVGNHCEKDQDPQVENHCQDDIKLVGTVVESNFCSYRG